MTNQKNQIADGGTVPMHMGREAPSASPAEIVAETLARKPCRAIVARASGPQQLLAALAQALESGLAWRNEPFGRMGMTGL